MEIDWYYFFCRVVNLLPPLPVSAVELMLIPRLRGSLVQQK